MYRYKRTLALALAAVLIATAGMALAAEQAKPDFKKFHTIVDLAFVKDIVDGKTKGMLIDSRPKRKKFDKGHIPGAVNIPDSQFAKMKTQLPQDKNALVVFYCEGLKCPLSHKSAFKAEALGYKNVKVYAMGYPQWAKAYGPGPKTEAKAAPAAKKEAPFKQYHSIVEGAFIKKVVDGKSMGLLIDSRPKKTKYDKGHIPGSLSLPTSQFDKMKGLLPADKKALVVFYCGGLKCALSHKAAFKAEAMGYKNVKVYAKGYPDWKKAYGAGPAMASSKSAAKPAAAGSLLKPGKEAGSVDYASFAKVLKDKPQSIILVDVRDAGEFKAGTFKSAINIPTDNLEKKLKGWKVDKPVVFVCGTGARSGEAYYMVQDIRPDLKDIVYYLDGELTFDGKGGHKYTAPK